MLTRILASVVLAPLFLAVLLFAPVGITTFMVSGIVTIAAFELMRAVGAGKNKYVCAVTLAAAALIPQCYWLQVDAWAVKLILLCLLFALFLAAVLTYGTEKAVQAEHVLFGLFGGKDGVDESAYASYVNETVRLSLYGDFLYPLAEESTLEDFYNEKPEGSYCDELTRARSEIWRVLRPFRMKLLRLAPARFIHFGT